MAEKHPRTTVNLNGEVVTRLRDLATSTGISMIDIVSIGVTVLGALHEAGATVTTLDDPQVLREMTYAVANDRRVAAYIRDTFPVDTDTEFDQWWDELTGSFSGR
jgi:hypothetical protein